MKGRTGLGGLAALLVLTATASLAGPAQGGAPPPQPRPQASEPDRIRAERLRRAGAPPVRPPEVRDETFRLMDAYVISNMQESLGLSDEQFTKALPLVKRLQSDRREFARKRMQALRLLRRSLNSGAATEAGVGDLLKDLKAATSEESDAALRNLDALDGVLTPLQQAKYRVFESEVDVRLRRLLTRSQERERPPQR